MKKYEIVDGLKVTRNKEKPYVCTTYWFWWEHLLGLAGVDRIIIDINHPSFISILKETKNKLEKYDWYNKL